MPRTLPAMAAAVLLVVLLATAAGARAADFTNPVIAGDHPDPTVVRGGGAYYASATTSTWAPVFPVFRSTDLVSWSEVGAVLPDPPPWAAGKFWAPELAHDGGQFFAYWGAARRDGRPCIALSTASRAEGPWRYRGRVACPAGGAIDAAPFRDADGSRWLLWKALGTGNGIRIQRLDPAGLRVQGPTYDLIAPTDPWEQGVTEGPSLVRIGGRYLLFYAGGHCCRPPCSYAEGVAVATTLLGPYTKNPNNPVLRGNDVWKCPGHGTVIGTGTPGVLAFLHHAYRADDGGDLRRQVLLDPLTLGADGWPVIGSDDTPVAGGPSPSAVAQQPAAAGFADAFAGPLTPGWEWLFDARPQIDVGRGTLAERCNGPTVFVARQVPVDRFTAVVTVEPPAGDTAAGLAADLGRGVRGIEVRHGRARAFVSASGRVQTGPSIAVPRRRPVKLIVGVAPGGALATYASWNGRPPVRVPEGPAAAGPEPTRIALTCRGRGAARFASIRVHAG